MSGHTWTTVSLPATASISGLTSTPDGTVCAFGQTGTAQFSSSKQPGATSATMLKVPTPASPPAVTGESGLAASGAGDIWLFGQYSTSQSFPGIAPFDGQKFTFATPPDLKGNSSFIYIAGGALLGTTVLPGPQLRLSGCKSRPNPVTWGDGQGMAVRHDDRPCPFGCST